MNYDFDKLEPDIEAIIALLPSGIYRLSDLLGDAWAPLEHKAALGIWFKQRVSAGGIPGVEPVGKTARNHQIYDVDGRSA